MNGTSKNIGIGCVAFFMAAASPIYAGLVLTGTQTETVTTSYNGADLSGESKADIENGGVISGPVSVSDSAELHMFAGSQITSGEDESFVVKNNAIFEVHGGDLFAVEEIALENSAAMTIAGGTVGSGRIRLYDSSSLTITGGQVNASLWTQTAISSAELNIQDGQFTPSANWRVYRGDTVNIYGGTISGSSIVNYDGVINVYGGSIERIQTRDAGTFAQTHVYGGAIGELNSRDTGITYIYGYDFSGLDIDENHIVQGSGILSGKYLDDTAFSVEITRTGDGGTVYAIPEPGTAVLGLVAFGLFACYVRRKR